MVDRGSRRNQASHASPRRMCAVGSPRLELVRSLRGRWNAQFSDSVRCAPAHAATTAVVLVLSAAVNSLQYLTVCLGARVLG